MYFGWTEIETFLPRHKYGEDGWRSRAGKETWETSRLRAWDWMLILCFLLFYLENDLGMSAGIQGSEKASQSMPIIIPSMILLADTQQIQIPFVETLFEGSRMWCKRLLMTTFYFSSLSSGNAIFFPFFHNSTLHLTVTFSANARKMGVEKGVETKLD